jgi:hypothetical protein
MVNEEVVAHIAYCSGHALFNKSAATGIPPEDKKRKERDRVRLILSHL